MTIEQALNEIGPERLMIVGGKAVFFNTHDPEEAAVWIERGAHTREFFSNNGASFSSRGRQGWEIHPLGALERVTRTKLTGKVEDITGEELVREARARRAVAGR